MSLQVWLPLTKDLRQQGLSNVTVTNNGATFSSAGKLGGCYSFGNGSASSNGLFLNSNLVDLMQEEYSVAVWVKPLGNHYHYNGTIFSSGDWNHTCYAFGLSQDNSQVDILCKGYNTYLTCAVPINTWTHLACTCDSNNVVRLYKNGEYIGSSTRSNKPDSDNATQAAIGRETYASGYFTFNGMLNDFRLYNHCLSQMEVKELSKGLVLHYPLNRSGLGQENLIRNTDFGGVSQKYTVTSGTEGGFTYTPTETIAANTEYIVSCRLRGNANMNLYKLCTGGNEALNWVNRSQLSTTEYRPFSIVFTYPSSKTLNQIYICTRYGTASTSIGDWFEIEPCSLKLEKGSIATPWCPNSSDALATTMGLNSTTEYDCSGFCNNGTRTGAFNWTSDTPRYNISTAFEKGIISIPNSFVTTADPIFSVSLWFKLKSGITYTAYTDLISFSSSSYSNQPFRLELCGTPVGRSIMWFRGPSGQSGGFAVKSDISTDEWYHTVLVSEGNKQYSYYVNGEKLGTYNGSANSWTPTGNVSLGENINGVFYESDVRVYATALSAEDVLELYHTAARIDNIGNTYVYQYIET